MKTLFMAVAVSLVLSGGFVSASASNMYGPWVLDKASSYIYQQGMTWLTSCFWKGDIFDGMSSTKISEEHHSRAIQSSDVRGCTM